VYDHFDQTSNKTNF